MTQQKKLQIPNSVLYQAIQDIAEDALAGEVAMGIYKTEHNEDFVDPNYMNLIIATVALDRKLQELIAYMNEIPGNGPILRAIQALRDPSVQPTETEEVTLN